MILDHMFHSTQDSVWSKENWISSQTVAKGTEARFFFAELELEHGKESCIHALRHARNLLLSEKNFMYAKLKYHCSEKTRDEVYEICGIGGTSKLKKKRLLDLLWTNQDTAVSITQMILDDNTYDNTPVSVCQNDISPDNSLMGTYHLLFRSSRSPPSLLPPASHVTTHDSVQWAQIKKDARIRANLLMALKACMASIEKLKTHQHPAKNDTKQEFYRNIIKRQCRHDEHWLDKRDRIIYQYFGTEESSKYSHTRIIPCDRTNSGNLEFYL